MLDLKEMLKAGVHFGHKASRWSPKMRPFIWGSKNKIHLIDISKTAFLLERSANYLKGLAKEGKSFLWVGTKKSAQKIVRKIATDLNMPFVVNRWIGGTLTNFDQVKKAITKLLHLRDVAAKKATHYTKKEVSEIQKEIGRLEKKIGGIVDLDYPPAAIVIVDAKKEHSVLCEAINAKIPVVAMVDTNTNPDGINFLIPANDDSPRSIELVMNYISEKVKEGQAEYLKAKKENIKAKEVKKETKAKTTTEPKKEVVKKVAKPKTEVKKETKAKATTEPKKEVVKKVAKPKVEPKKEVKAKETKATEVKKEVKAKETKATEVKKETKAKQTKEPKKEVAKKVAKPKVENKKETTKDSK